MATLADGGRITEQLVIDEIARLKEHWVEPNSDILTSLLPTATLEELDAFDLVVGLAGSLTLLDMAVTRRALPERPRARVHFWAPTAFSSNWDPLGATR